MKKKRLLVFHRALAPYRVDFFNSLSASFDSEIFYLNKNLSSQKFDQQILNRTIAHQYRYLTVGFNIKKSSIRFGIYSIIKKYKPDIVLTSEFNYIAIIVLIIKILTKLNFNIITLTDDSLDRAKKCKGLRKYIRNFCIKKFNGVIFSNLETLGWIKNSIKTAAKLMLFPIIQKDELFRQKLSNSEAICLKYVDDYDLLNKKVILFVGRLVKVKGVDRLIHAYSLICKNHTDSILIIVGDGIEKEKLLKLKMELMIGNQLIFAGRFEFKHLYAWYLTSNIFVLPSHWEAFGTVVNESLLSGVPVLCSNLAGASELIIPGINGDVFDPFNINELSKLLDKYLQKAKPLTMTDNRIMMKSNLMPYSYNEKIEKLVNQINENFEETED